MNNKTTLLILFTLLIFQNTFSQRKTDPTPDEINIAKELKEQYPDASIALLNYDDVIEFNFDKKKQLINVNQKIKKNMINIDERSDIQEYIFYNNGSEVSDFEISYKNNRDARFEIEDEAYKSKDLFHVDTRVKYTNIDFPVKGFRYFVDIEKNIEDVKYFTKIYFSNEFPVKKRTITFHVPDWLELEFKEFNFEGFDITKTEEENPKDKTTIYTFTAENLAEMHKEEDTPGPTYIYPHILILAKSYTNESGKVKLFETTQDLYNWYKHLVDDLKNNTNAFKNKVTELIKDTSSDEEKIKNIYYWVQDNIRYIAFEDGIAGFKPDEAENVFNKKYGDCKGMANLLKQMLKEAGFDARLTWIGTKRIAYDYSTPNLSVDNHMICTLLKDGKTIYLDGTEKFNSFGEYANRIQGKQVLIEDGEKYILKTIPEATATKNKSTTTYDFVLKDNIITGTASKTMTGETKASILYYLHTIENDKKDNFINYLLNKGNSNITVTSVELSNTKDRDNDLKINYDLSVNNAVSEFDNTYYIDLDFDKQYSNSLVSKRKTDLVFSHKKQIKSVTNLSIPENFTIESLPKGITKNTSKYDIEVSFKNDKNVITYNKIFTIKSDKLTKEDFEDWDQTIKQLNEIYSQQIILRKK